MARPRKQGLEYFPFECDFFAEERMVAIAGEFGLKGEIITIHLLCAVYRNGYFVEWGELMKFKLLKELPGVSVELLDAVVSRLVRWGFFDEGLFNSVGVLTSEEIQRTYFSVTRKRVGTVEFPYILSFRGRNTSLNGVSDGETNVSDGETRQIKGNYIKKPTDVGKERAAFPPPPTPSVEIGKENFPVNGIYSGNAFLGAKQGNESAKIGGAVKVTSHAEKTRQNSLTGNFQKKDFPAVDYRKPVAELTAICIADASYLDSVLWQLHREEIQRSREEVLEELKHFPKHLVSYGNAEPRRLQDFKAHFMSYLRKKWTAATPAKVTTKATEKPDYGNISSEI